MTIDSLNYNLALALAASESNAIGGDVKLKVVVYMSDIFNWLQSGLSWFIDLSSNFGSLLQNWLALFWRFLEELFKNETLRLWVQALASPIALIIIALYINQGFEKRKRKEDSENRRQEILRQYLHQMTEFLITHKLTDKLSELLITHKLAEADSVNHKLLEAKYKDPVILGAKSLTVTVIRELEGDNDRIGQVSSFLVNSKLATGNKENPSILRNADFSLVNLSKADFRSVNFNSANFSGADLKGANLKGANLESANLESANLKGANLKGADLSSAKLSSAKLNITNLNSDELIAGIVGVYFKRANPINVFFYGADFYAANLSHANLKGANLNSADLNSADLSRADLGLADLSRADLIGADLSRADLKFAKLREAKLREAKLNSANLKFADLSRANLKFADLKLADLSYADLIGADLIGAKLRGADLEQADFRSKDETGVGLKIFKLPVLDQFLVTIVYENTSASEKGIKPKDTIVKINGKETNKINIDEADKLLFDEAGTKVTLTINTSDNHCDLENKEFTMPVQGLDPDEIKQAKNWEKAKYDPEFRQELGLPAEPTEETESN